MAKPKKNKDIKYAQRLKELKEKLKPYRNKRTVNLLRVITGSSRKYLHKYWESLETVLTGQYSPDFVERRLQSVANMMTENGEKASRAAHSSSIEHSMVSEQLIHTDIESEANNEAENVTHVEIDSKEKKVDNMRHVNIEPRVSMFATSNVETTSNETHLNSNSNAFENAQVFNRLSH